MGSTNAMLTQMIQDAVLKLCTQNVVFNKALEIDGIICVSPGDESKEIVVKMHRTIVKPTEQQVNPSSEGWSTQIGNSDYYQPSIPTTPRQLTDSGGFQRRPSPRITQSLPPKRPTVNRDNAKQPPSSPYYSPLKPPAIPSATQETPGSYKSDSSTAVGDVTIKDEPPSSPKGIKRSLSDENTPTDTPEPEHSANKHSKISTDLTDTIDAVEPGPSDLDMDNVNVKQENEEPITIELDDDDDEEEGGGYEEGDESSMAGASWMGGDDTIDSNADPNDPNTGFVSHGPELRKRHVIINNRWRTVQMKQRNPSQYFDDDEKLYKCDKCMFTTAHKTSITRHVDVMHGDKKNSGVFHCDQCPKKCRTAYLLNEHIHGKHQAGYMCDLCGKKLGTKGGLRHHKREIHEGRFRFVCKICDMKFRSGEAMDGHMNSVHTLKAPYICEKCARSYYHKRSLKNHLKFCVGPKGKPTIITCDFDGCGLTFMSNGGKIDHIAAMHTNKQHICNVCSKSYPYRSSLTKHRRAMGHKKFPNIKKEKVEIDDGEIEPVEDMGIGVDAAVVEKDNIVDDDYEIPEKDGTFNDGDNNNQDELDI